MLCTFTVGGQTSTVSNQNSISIVEWVKRLPNKYTSFGIETESGEFIGSRDHALKTHRKTRKKLHERITNIEAVLFPRNFEETKEI